VPCLGCARIGPKHSDGCYSDAQHEAHIVRVVDALLAAFQQFKEDSKVLRLKMLVQEVKNIVDNKGEKSQEEIRLNFVYGEEGTPNRQWSKWTPSAGLTMTINNPDAFGKVLPGQFMYVDLTPCEKDSL
jgi:hypothetical protein